MKTIKFSVPPTREVGSYSGTCSASHGETYRQSALWEYNSCRAHDGLPPVSRMPSGTVYTIPRPPYYVQRADGRQVETVDEFETRAEAIAMRKEYCMSDPSARFYLSRRPCKGWND